MTQEHTMTAKELASLHEAWAALSQAREFLAKADGIDETPALYGIIKDCEERIVELILKRGERVDG